MKLPLQTIQGQPLVNICAVKRQKYVDLQYLPEELDLFDGEKNLLFADIAHKGFWRLKVKSSKPPRYNYFLILKESESAEALQKYLPVYAEKSINTQIKSVGGQIYIDERNISDNEKFLLLSGPFGSEEEALEQAAEYGQKQGWRIHREIKKEGRGIIEIYDADYDNFTEAVNEIRLVPKNLNSYFNIKHFQVRSNHFNRQFHEDLQYQGVLKILIDEEQTLSGINELPVEDYLKGVLYSEIGEQSHPEFAKSMAIVARSHVFARLGQKHSNEGFDFCSDSHCLRYYGKNFNNPVIENALQETRGVLLKSGDKVCNAYFSYSCGGHTENTSGVWLNEDVPYVTGRFDGKPENDPHLDLTRETDVRKWILDRPEVYCKVDPTFLKNNPQLAANSFRWEAFYTRQELEEIIKLKTGQDIGILYDILPVQRGVSGRIKKLQILGSLKNVEIAGETYIRSSLAQEGLNSSCFIIQTEMDDEGVPLNFMFIGAGMGHGVGLCKVGAARMASENQTCEKILKHYFQNCETTRIY